MSLTTKHKLTSLFKKAMGRNRLLPSRFSAAVNLIAATGMSPKIIDSITPLRHIIVNPVMAKNTPHLGCYFPERLPPTPGSDETNWKELGWDGKPYMMLFPTIEPEVWVILHEFAHYLDDAFIHIVGAISMCRYYSSPAVELDATEEFLNLRHQMQLEYEAVHKMTRNAVVECAGLEAAEADDWWKKIPDVYLRACIPSDYAALSFSEWFAECFQTWCIHREWSTLPDKAPHTARFLQYLCSEKVFGNVNEPVAFSIMPELAVAD